MCMIDTLTVDRALRNYIAVIGDCYYDDVQPNFWSFLKNPIDQSPLEANYTFDEETCRKIKMLAGPYYRTVIKAAQARANHD